MKKKGISLLLCITMIISFMMNIEFAFGQEQKKEKITVYANVTADIYEKYVKGFENKYPNVDVEYICLNDYDNEMRELMKKGDYGDVMFTPGFVTEKYLVEYFEPVGTYQELSNKYNYIDRSHRIGDTVYSVPSSAYLSGIVYNKAVFYGAGISDMPNNIAEFYEDLKLIKERTDAIPFCSSYGASWALYNWTDFPYIEMTGDPDFRCGEFLYTKNPFQKGSTHYNLYKMLYDIVKNGLAEPDLNIDWGTEIAMLNNGELASAVVGSWALKSIKAAGNHGDDIGFITFPNKVNGKRYATILTDYCYSISNKSTNKAMAKKFIEYMIDESGYAVGEERISIVKSDIIPEAYSEIKDVVIMSNSAFQGNGYEYYCKMSEGFDPVNSEEIKRVIEAAAGIRQEEFDTIIEEWNSRWEAGRPEEMNDEISEADSGKKEHTDKNILYDSQTKNIEVKLSDTEKEYLKTIDSLKIGFIKDRKPYQNMAYDNYNKLVCEGMSGDVCQMSAKKLGKKVEYIAYDSNSELVEGLNKGEVLIAAGVEKLEEYEEYLRFSKPYITYNNVIAKRHGASEIREAVVRGDNISSTLEKNKTYEADSMTEVFEAISSGKADFAVVGSYSAQYYAKDGEYDNIQMVPSTKRQELCIAVAESTDNRLLSIINKCVLSISDEKLQMMLVDAMEIAEKDITMDRLLKAYPIQFSLLIILIVSSILLMIQHSQKQKLKNLQAHEMDMLRYQTLTQLMDECVFEYHLADKIIEFDEKFDKIFGIKGIVHINERTKEQACISDIIEICQDAVNGGENYARSEDMQFKDINGVSQWYKIIVHKLAEPGDDFNYRFIGKIMNVQKDKEEKQRIQEEAERDVLTGLSNRKGFERNYLSLRENNVKGNIVVAILDIDNFKRVNDTLGHEGGDKALKLLANRLAGMKAEGVFSARYGGDEFIMCICNRTKDDCIGLLKCLVSDMDREINFRNKRVPMSISLGAVMGDYDKHTFDEMLCLADSVLYDIKMNGKNDFRVEEV